jgi:hypothetical protein
VPWEVSELVVYFLGLGRPFVDDLQMMHYDVEESTTFFWEPPSDRQEEEEEEDSDKEDDGEKGQDNEGDTGRRDGRILVPANLDRY